MMVVGSVNGPQSIVLSGSHNVVQHVLKLLHKSGDALQIFHAFHSTLMHDMEDDFICFIYKLDIHRPLTVSLVSTVTGKIVNFDRLLICSTG